MKKRNGEEFKESYTILAPEELRFWTHDFKWSADSFEDVSLIYIRVSASKELDKHVKTWTKRAPAFLDDHEFSNGSHSTVTRESVNCRIDATTITTLNNKMDTLSKEFKITSWPVTKIVVNNPKNGADIAFSVHNPDGIGPDMYVKQIKRDGRIKEWDEITYAEMSNSIGGFRGDKIAQCTTNLVPQKACIRLTGREHKRQQIITRKKKAT